MLSSLVCFFSLNVFSFNISIMFPNIFWIAVLMSLHFARACTVQVHPFLLLDMTPISKINRMSSKSWKKNWKSQQLLIDWMTESSNGNHFNSPIPLLFLIRLKLWICERQRWHVQFGWWLLLQYTTHNTQSFGQNTFGDIEIWKQKLLLCFHCPS